eukprot:9543997-Alexandrium_andersonii.AAC.1
MPSLARSLLWRECPGCVLGLLCRSSFGAVRGSLSRSMDREGPLARTFTPRTCALKRVATSKTLG